MALVACAMSFSIRADVMPAWAVDFVINEEDVGRVASAAFLGFALSIAVGSSLCDSLGMRALLFLACAGHTLGAVATIFAPSYRSLLGASFVIGLANGLVEAVINPLCATLHPQQKTHKLNVLHAWWPAGLILGALGSHLIGAALGLGWQVKMALLLAPSVIYGALLIGAKFPVTERAASGASARAMFGECARPGFLVLWLCMWLTAATELVPAQWVPSVLTRTAQTPGTLVFVYMNVLMFLLRSFSGRVLRGRSPVAVLWVSAAVSAVGLLALGSARSALPAYLAATVFAAGTCFFWPTMLAVASEQFPKGGAFALGMMGTAGNLSIAFFCPRLGAVWDHYTAKALPPGEDLAGLMARAKVDEAAAQTLEAARAAGASMPFRWAAALPLILLVVFGLIWLRHKARGGYQAVRLERETRP